MKSNIILPKGINVHEISNYRQSIVIVDTDKIDRLDGNESPSKPVRSRMGEKTDYFEIVEK